MRLDFPIDVARGYWGTDIQRVRKFGHNLDIDTTFEHVWDVGGTYPFPQAATAVRIAAGGNVADTAAGAGAREVTIAGLDENWTYAEECLATAGASASTYTTTTFVRIFRAYVSSTGTYGGTNTGAVTIATAAPVTLAYIPAGTGQTQMALYTVPAGKIGYMTAVSIEMESLKIVTTEVLRRENADDIAAPMSPLRLVSEFGAQGEHLHHIYDVPPAKFDEKSDVIVRAKNIGAGTAEVTVEFSMILMDKAKYLYTPDGAVC